MAAQAARLSAAALAWSARADAALLRALPPEDAPIELHRAMRYAVLGGGKRLRPILVFAAGSALGADAERLDAPAAAVEIIHAYSLVHDDLPAMDDDALRRGRPTCHVAFGEATAILAGDALQALAFELLAGDARLADAPGILLDMLHTLAEIGPGAAAAVALLARRAGARELLAGQAIDLTAPPKDLASIERMHAAKTGALFAASAELGAIAAGAPRETCAALGRYGMAIGIAFQHADDRDDAELVEHAAAATARMKELCGQARHELRGLSATVLDELAGWISARA